MIPHYNKAQASKNLFEPVHGNLFEVTIIPPSGVTGGEMLLEHVNNISGLDTINPAGEAVTQKYKFADRSYDGMPDTTSADIVIEFSLNLNEANQMYVYKTLKAWRNKQYNPSTGEMGLKKNYVGTLIIVEYNREGGIFRKITLPDSFINGPITGLDAHDYTSSEPLTISATFRCDAPEEELA